MRYRFFRVFAVLFAAACIAFFIGQPACAATYYVRKTGNNSNNGLSPATAKLTIDNVANLMVAGDRVYVGAGTYSESVTPNNDGTAVNPIRFIADTTGAFTGDAGNVDVVSAGGNAFDINTDNYHQIIGFRTRNSTRGIRVISSTGCTIQNCQSYSNTDGIRCDDAITCTITGCTLRNNTTYGLDLIDTSTVTVTSTLIYSNAHGAHTTDTGSNLTLLKCRIYTNTTRGVFAVRGAVTMKNCLVYSNTGEGVYLDPSGPGPAVTIWNCTISDQTTDAVYQRDGSLTLNNSILSFNGGFGIRWTGGTSTTHTYNVFHSNTGGNYSGVTASTGEITGNPKFNNKAGGDYTLIIGSRALNKGTTATGIVDDDFNSAARPIGPAWDVGAYESTLGSNPIGVRVTEWIEIP